MCVRACVPTVHTPESPCHQSPPPNRSDVQKRATVSQGGTVGRGAGRKGPRALHTTHKPPSHPSQPNRGPNRATVFPLDEGLHHLSTPKEAFRPTPQTDARTNSLTFSSTFVKHSRRGLILHSTNRAPLRLRIQNTVVVFDRTDR
jgi:hypothetical protein